MSNNSHIELERRFLIENPPAGLDRYEAVEIAQGYVCAKPAVRFRKAGSTYYLTIKSGPLTEHEERETELTQEQFEEFWPLTAGKRVFKTRYKIPHGERLVEFDIFHGIHTGLLIAEVEFPGREASEAFQPLEWFGREITGEVEYSNAALAAE